MITIVADIYTFFNRAIILNYMFQRYLKMKLFVPAAQSAHLNICSTLHVLHVSS